MHAAHLLDPALLLFLELFSVLLLALTGVTTVPVDVRTYRDEAIERCDEAGASVVVRSNTLSFRAAKNLPTERKIGRSRGSDANGLLDEFKTLGSRTHLRTMQD